MESSSGEPQSCGSTHIMRASVRCVPCRKSQTAQRTGGPLRSEVQTPDRNRGRSSRHRFMLGPATAVRELQLLRYRRLVARRGCLTNALQNAASEQASKPARAGFFVSWASSTPSGSASPTGPSASVALRGPHRPSPPNSRSIRTLISRSARAATATMLAARCHPGVSANDAARQDRRPPGRSRAHHRPPNRDEPAMRLVRRAGNHPPCG